MLNATSILSLILYFSGLIYTVIEFRKRADFTKGVEFFIQNNPSNASEVFLWAA